MHKLRIKNPPRISPKDTASLHDAILALHSFRDHDSFRKAVANIFMDLIPADYFSLGDARIDFAKRTFKVLNIWESRPVRVGALLEAFERNMFEHPFVQYVIQHGNIDRALMLSDFLTLAQLRKTRFYRETLLPANFGHLISVGSLSGPGLATLALSRPPTQPGFTERDRRMLELLQPHFDLARTNIERETLARASRTRSLKSAGLTPREIEVALWLAQGKANPEMATILDTPVRTIEKHVEHILGKLGVVNRVEAAVTIAEIIHE